MAKFAFELHSDLCDAAEEGDLSTVQQLVASGVDINERGFMNTTALMSAVMKKQTHVVEWIASQPQCDPNALNAGGTGALALAARDGQLKAVKAICAHPQTDINLLGKYGGTPLHNAAGFGHQHVVRFLLSLPQLQNLAQYTDEKYSASDVARRNGYPQLAERIDKHFAAQLFTPSQPSRLVP